MTGIGQVAGVKGRSTAEIVVRRAREEDLPAVLGLIDLMNKEGKEWWVFQPRTGFEREVEATYRASLRDPVAHHVVAEVAGRVVGSALARIERVSTRSDQRALELSGVVVDPAFRRTGVGRALVSEAARFARARALEIVTLKVFAQNDGGMRFWEEMGFTPRIVQFTGRVEDLEGDPHQA